MERFDFQRNTEELQMGSKELLARFIGERKLSDIEAETVIKNFDTAKIMKEIEGGLLADEQLLKSLVRLFLEVKDKLSHYDAIVGDDVSGRLYALIFKRLADQQRKNSMPTFFVAPTVASEVNGNLIFEQICAKKGDAKKVLIVTDHMESGEHVMMIAEALKKAGVDYDIAAVSIDKEIAENEINDKTNVLGRIGMGKVSYGTLGQEGLKIWGSEYRKDFGIEDHPTSEVNVVRNSDYDGTAVALAREEVRIVADELAACSKILEYR